LNALDVIESLYFPLGWDLKKITEESQNNDYGGYLFELKDWQVRFRIAKITPKKNGQFVAFWYKEAGKNLPYHYENSPDFLVVYTETPKNTGHFVFPKECLKKYGILSTKEQTGKMAMRVYPPWDQPMTPQALATQKWQAPYFVKEAKKMAEMYSIKEKE